MAADSAEQLLLAFGLDLSPVKEAVNGIAGMLGSLNQMAEDLEKKSKDTATTAKADAAQLKASAQAAVLAAKEAALAETKKAAEAKTATAEFKAQTAQHQANVIAAKADTAEQQKKLVEIKAQNQELRNQQQELRNQTAEINKQVAELRKRRLEQQEQNRAGTGAEAGGFLGAIGGIGRKATQGLLGGGMAGSVAGGLLAGGGILMMLDAAGEMIERFVDKLKELTVESGKLNILQDQFEKLARGSGTDAVEMMNHLNESTEGLVGKVNLLKMANAALKSPVGISHEQLFQLTHDVTQLSEAAGNTAQAGVDRLTTAMLRSRPAILSTVTGVIGLRDVMRNIPPAMNAAERSALQFHRAIDLLHKRALQLGELPQTLEQMMTRLKVAGDNLMLAFGQGFNASAGTQEFIRTINGMAARMGGLEGVARKMGDTLGQVLASAAHAVKFLVDNVDLLIGAAKLLGAAFLAVGIDAAITGMVALTGKIYGVAAAEDVAYAAGLRLGVALKGIAGSLPGLAATASILMLQHGFEGIKETMTKITGETYSWGDAIKGVGEWLVGTTIGVDNLSDAVRDAHDRRVKEENTRRDLQRDLTLSKEHVVVDNTAKGAATGAALHFGMKLEKSDEDKSLTLQQQMKAAQEQMQLRRALAKEQLAIHKAQLEQEKELDNEAYKAGRETEAAHYTEELYLAQQAHATQLTEAEEARDSQLELLKKQLDLGLIHLEDYNKKVDIAQAAYRTAEINADTAFMKQKDQLREQHDAMERQAEEKRIQAAAAAQQRQLTAEQKSAQHGLQIGTVSPDDYLSQMTSIYTREADVQIEQANRVYAAGLKNDASRETRLNAIDKAYDDLEQKLQDLQDREVSVRESSIQHQFQPQQQFLESQISFGKEQAGAGLESQPIAETKDLLANIDQQRRAYETLLSAMTQAGMMYSNEWFQILDKVEATYQAQVKYNQELQKMQDKLAPIADLMGGIGKTISSIWTGGSTGDLGHTISQAAASMRSMQQNIYTAAQAFGIKTPQAAVQKDAATLQLEQRAKALFDPLSQASQTVKGGFDKVGTGISILADKMSVLGTAVDALGSKMNAAVTGQAQPGQVVGASPNVGGTGIPETPQISEENAGGTLGNLPEKSTTADSPQKSFQSLTTGVMAAVSALGSFVDSIGHAQSAMSGALGGGMSGASMGQGIGSLFGPMGGAIGAIGGAALGGIIGGITGSKNEAMRHNIEDLNRSYRQIMQQFNENTNNLQQAIIAMENLIAQAEAMQASSKKGGQQYAQLIQQYQQELNSLQDQQHKIILDMQTQLAILQTPLSGQSYISSINDLIKQYDQFVGAAKNAKDLAQANEFLHDSLQNLATSYSQQLLQNESQAVQDALQLNDLYYQRTQYLNQLNNQIQGILQQGSLTRQQTQAQKKGTQIEQLEIQSGRQLDQMNQQIALQSAKVDAESKVFSLATTRIGLETQLLQLQGAQTSYQMQQIAALQQLVNTLASGNYNFSTLQALLNALGFSTAAGTAPNTGTTYGGSGSAPGYTVPAGYSTNAAPAADGLTTAFAQAYADRASLGYGSFRGQTL